MICDMISINVDEPYVLMIKNVDLSAVMIAKNVDNVSRAEEGVLC